MAAAAERPSPSLRFPHKRTCKFREPRNSPSFYDTLATLRSKRLHILHGIREEPANEPNAPPSHRPHAADAHRRAAGQAGKPPRTSRRVSDKATQTNREKHGENHEPHGSTAGGSQSHAWAEPSEQEPRHRLFPEVERRRFRIHTRTPRCPAFCPHPLIVAVFSSLVHSTASKKDDDRTRTEMILDQEQPSSAKTQRSAESPSQKLS